MEIKELWMMFAGVCVCAQVHGGVSLVRAVEGVCGQRRPELLVLPRPDRQRRAVRWLLPPSFFFSPSVYFTFPDYFSWRMNTYLLVFRSGLVPHQGLSGGERRLHAGAGGGLDQAAVLVRDGGRTAPPGAQGTPPGGQEEELLRDRMLTVYVCVCARWWTYPAP